MMAQNDVSIQMLGFHKAVFDCGFNVLVMLQDQTERAVNAFLEQTAWLPDEGKKVMKEWFKAYKKGCEDFKSITDTNFKKVEEFIASAGK